MLKQFPVVDFTVLIAYIGVNNYKSWKLESVLWSILLGSRIKLNCFNLLF